VVATLVAAPRTFGRLSPAWRHAIAVFVTVRLVASLTALVGYAALPPEKISPAGAYSKPAYSKAVEIAFGHWERWDALWFMHVAQDGYQANSQSAAIMPVYPLAIRALHGLSGLPWLICGLIISNAAFLVALYVLYRLAELELGDQVARRSSWYLALFPGSLFFLAPYTESLYLLLTVCAFFAARRSQWLLAGVSAAVAPVRPR
jgi:Gpi18-like mannosyltransferase